MKQVLEDEFVQQHIKCQKGCSACCYTQVSVTQDEAILLAELVESGIKIDMQKLFRQKEAGNSATHWYQLKYEDRACVFLNEKNECSIYENRPSVCRTNLVISNPALCDTSDGLEKPIQLVNTFSSDMAIYAAFKYSTQAGSLPSMLWKALEVQKDVLFQPDNDARHLAHKSL